jgi:hypothetical protein
MEEQLIHFPIRNPHSSIASAMRSSSAGMKAAVDWLRATDWDAIEKSPQLD